MLRAMRRSRRRLLLIITPILAVLAGLGIAAPMVAQAAQGCEVDYQIQNQWPGGFTANVNITNLGDPIDGWQLQWAFPSGQQVTSGWNADISASGGQVTAKNLSYNARVASNGSTSFGFNGSWSGSNDKPTQFTLNGVVCTGQVGQPTTPGETTSPPPTGGNAMETVAAMQPGWNLGNSLDAVGSDETAWGNPRITQTLIQNVKAQGYNSIRIPVTWDNHQGGAPDYTVDPAYLDRVEEVVNWALDADLYVLINIHHDSWIWMADMQSNQTQVMDRYESIWTAVSARFRDASPKLLFESVNEPQFNNVDDATAYNLLDQLNTTFHQIVRASGGNNADRVLVLPTLHTNDEQPRLDALNQTIDSLNDPNIAATVHYYGFWPFSVNVAGYTKFNDEVRQYVIDAFDRVHNAFVAQGTPVILGEWGLLGFDVHTGTIEQGEKLKYFEFLEYYAQQKDITHQIWDNGQHFGRTSFQWSDPELFAIMKAGWTGRSGTASTDQVFVEKAATVTDKSVTLNLNGTTFELLRQGSTTLVQGTDYTISGNTLTIKASKLTSLIGSGGYGKRADLHVDFSSGPDWRISIVSSDTPILQSASGSTSSFAIPTQFRGDQLATMEAKYSDGANAGPHDWTSYKEFARAFQPNYEAGTISLTADFFAAVGDGRPVTLTFHFWSGKTVTYTVTKSGTSVTGTG